MKRGVRLAANRDVQKIKGNSLSTKDGFLSHKLMLSLIAGYLDFHPI